MRYRSTMFAFLMRHTSTWMIWLINKMRAFGCQRSHLWFMNKVHHAGRITVWVAMSSHGLLVPICFEEPVNTERYLSMLRKSFVPDLATGLLLHTRWFVQDGARPHTANVSWDFLHDTFVSRVISTRFPDRSACGQNWQRNSPDLNPCDYFLWGITKG
jgi:hypothetical protein